MKAKEILLGLLMAASPAAQADSPLQFGGVPVLLTVNQISQRALQIELSPLEGQGSDSAEPSSVAFVPFSTTEILQARDLPAEKEIAADPFHLTIKPDPFTVSVRRADGTLIQEILFGGTNHDDSIAFQTTAPVLGLGEGGPQFDRRGQLFSRQNGEAVASLATEGARIAVPFLIGTDGWALFVAAPAGAFDLRAALGIFHPRNGAAPGRASVFVIDAQQPADALREFVRLTGSAIMPPKWALGYLQSHRTLSSESNLLAEARTFREKQLPCDAFILLGTGFCPAGWNLGHDSFQFNTNVFGHDSATVIRELHDDHLRVVLHVVPLQRDYPSLHGQIPPAPGEILDTQDIGAYWNRHRPLFAAGVDGWWPDEGDWLDVPSRLARHRLYYQGPLADRPNVRPWDLQRNGYAGIARYGGWFWSGDITSTWITLATQVAVGLNASVSVSPFWGTDIGGFFPTRTNEYTGELYARWFQFAAFCPLFRSHGRNWQLHLPWGWNTGTTGPVESRSLPDPAELHNAAIEPVCRQYLNLRYRLLPYNYTLFRQACDTGLPPMRALWLQYPRDPDAAQLGDEYLWGADLLIAPVTAKSATSRHLYLPPGLWHDWWSGQILDGHRWIDRPVDLATLPIYARAGAIIPLDPVRQFTAQKVAAPTGLRIFPGADGTFTLYDDDGQSLDYSNGSDPKIIWIRFQWNDAARRLTLAPGASMKHWLGGPRSFTAAVVGSSANPKRIKFHGIPVTVQF